MTQLRFGLSSEHKKCSLWCSFEIWQSPPDEETRNQPQIQILGQTERQKKRKRKAPASRRPPCTIWEPECLFIPSALYFYFEQVPIAFVEAINAIVTAIWKGGGGGKIRLGHRPSWTIGGDPARSESIYNPRIRMHYAATVDIDRESSWHGRKFV